MGSEHFDFVVIGGGSAGYAAARTAREAVNRVAIIDGSKDLGGLCILRGCMPSKTLIYSAEMLHQAQRGTLFGLNIPNAAADMSAIHARKLRMIDDFASYRQSQLQSDRFTLFRDFASFVDEETVELRTSGLRITADHFLIATGSDVNSPTIPGLADVPSWTSDDILELETRPESIIVLGGGIVATELGQFLQRIGTKVTLIQRSPAILKEASANAAHVVMQALRDEGMTLFTDTHITRISKSPGGVTVEFTVQGAPRRAEAAHLFNALGRRPSTRGLGLDAAGVELAQSGQIVVDAFQRTHNPRIYAAGDATGPYEIVHLAVMQGEVAAKHACGLPTQPVDYTTRTSVVFTDPQIAEAGLPLLEAQQQDFDLIEAEYPFDDHGRSILMEARYGYVRAWADKKTGQLIGAECVGKDAGELIHTMAVAVQLKAKVADLVKVHWYHPTLAEIWSYPLEDLLEQITESAS